MDIHFGRPGIATIDAIYREFEVLDPAANHTDLGEVLSKIFKIDLFVEDYNLEVFAELTQSLAPELHQLLHRLAGQ